MEKSDCDEKKDNKINKPSLSEGYWDNFFLLYMEWFKGLDKDSQKKIIEIGGFNKLLKL